MMLHNSISDISQEFKICDRKQLIDLQKTDTTLDKVISYVSEEHNENQSSFFVYYVAQMYSHSYLLQDLQTVYLKLVLQCHLK
jgi:hypothetical protein